MKRKSLLKLVTFILALTFGGSLATAQTFKRDWVAHPAIVEVDTTEDIFVVSDAHGDPDRLMGVLLAAKLVEPLETAVVNWAGGKAVLVVTGDMIDKGDNSLKVIEILETLQVSASRNGGRVIITMGNHEAAFLADYKSGKTDDFVNELKKDGKDFVAISQCKDLLGTYLCNLPIAARVNDWFFSHAGYTNGRSITEIKNAIENGVNSSGFKTLELVGDDSILEARLNKKNFDGLPWIYGGKKKATDADVNTLLTNYATALGVKHMVQGHQNETVKFPPAIVRNPDEMFQRYGLLFLIDTGMSRGVDGNTSGGGALRITRQVTTLGTTQTASVICADGTTTTLWDSVNKQDVGAQLCAPPPGKKK